MKYICHIDLNAFFAQVEMNRHPEYKDKPLSVGGNIGRAVIATSNYEARKYGVRSGMPISEAYRLCPKLINIPGDYHEYSKQSQFFFDEVKKTFPLIEMASIDECYVDSTNVLIEKSRDEIYEFLFDFQFQLLAKTGLKCSIGLGQNKFMAKMGSDYKKPLGLTLLLDKKDLETKIWPLPIENMFGIGKKTAPKLLELGVNTIGDLANNKSIKVIKALGSMYDWVYFEANGGGSDELSYASFDPKSTSCDSTFDFDTTDYEEIKNRLIYCSKKVGNQLRFHNKVTKTIGIKIRDASFNTKSRRISIDHFIDSDDEICFYALKIFDVFYNDQPIRLIGCMAEGCIDKGKETLVKKDEQLTIDEALYLNKKGEKN